MDGRSILTSLFSVKYFLIPEEKTSLLPYDFSQQVGNTAYENNCYLPFGFTTSSYINREVYEKLTVTQKQQALLQGVVLEGNVETDSIQQADLTFCEKSVPYTVTMSDGLSMEGNKIEVTKADATMTLSYSGLKDSETYFIIEGLDYKDNTPTAGVAKSQNRLHITVGCEDVEKKITYLSSENNFYSDIHDYLINTGYRKEATDTITLKFKELGSYRFESMKVVCQPMEQLEQQVENLSQESLEDVKVGDNQINGTICLDQDRLLCLSIPYSEGWKAYVDDEEADLLQADTMFMALKLSAGEHRIQLIYATPYLRISCAISIVGWILFALIAGVYYVKQKRLGEFR